MTEIAEAAGRAGLQFVIVTDHGDGFRDPAPPRYYGRVLCIDAVEVSTTDGHYAALGLGRVPYPLGGEARDVVEDVARLGGFGIAAHPDSSKRDLRWTEWEAPVDAIEWLNADSQWRDQDRWRLLPALFQYPFRPEATVVSIFDRPDAVLRRWDAMTRERRVVGLAAADAHARLGLGGKSDPYDERLYLKLPSYEAVFRAFALRAELAAPFSGRATQDAHVLLDALRQGHVYTVIDGLASPAVLSFTANSGGVTARQGDALRWQGAATVRVAANGPAGQVWRLFSNGRVVHEETSRSFTWPVREPGVFRVEAYVPGAPGTPPLPWLVSNPIYIGTPPNPVTEKVAPPATTCSPVGHQWAIEKDASSQGLVHLSAESADSSRTRVEFALGADRRASPFVALATRDVAALRQAGCLALRAAASRPMRLSVQVREAAAGDHRWQRSIYLDASPRDVTVWLSDMRVAGTGDRTPPGRARVESLLFVIDATHARPGDSGSFWISEVRAR